MNWKKIKSYYEPVCLVWGVSTILIVTFFLALDPDKCIIFMEPLWYIRIPEVILGIISIPYYIKKIYGK